MNYTVTWYESQWSLWTVGILGTAATGRKSLISLARYLTIRHLGEKFRELIVWLVLRPTPTSLEDLLCSFQASVELDRVELSVLKLLMPEMFLVCVLL